MITVEQYFRDFEHTETHTENAKALLNRVAMLIAFAETQGVKARINKKTGSIISGDTYGGFRPLSCPIGAEKSAHKQGMAVDIYDPDNALDAFVNDIILTKFDLYREHPDDTQHWLHVSTKIPASKRRTFKP